GGQSARVTTGPPRFITGTPTPATYTLALHDALPILLRELSARLPEPWRAARCQRHLVEGRPCEIGPAHGLLPHEAQPTACREETDRKSTRLNSSHVKTSYAVFCLKKKKSNIHPTHPT